MLASSQPPPNTRSVWRNPIHFIACAFGIGLLPIMPGTYATLAGGILHLLLNRLPLPYQLLLLTLLFLAGIWLCGKTNRDFGTDDHPAVAFDELATFPIVFLGLPTTPYSLILGFLFFRLLDIWKPGPIGWIDRHVHGGFGVMADDLIAAICAWLLLWGVISILPNL